MGTGAEWTDDDVSKLRRLAASGASDETIARALGRTERSVANKRYKLGIVSRRLGRERPAQALSIAGVDLHGVTTKALLDELASRGLAIGPRLQLRQVKHTHGRCHGCGRMIHICKDGRFGKHPATTQLVPGGAGQCPGAGKYPASGTRLRGLRSAEKAKTRKAERLRLPRELDAAELYAVHEDGTAVRVQRVHVSLDRLTTCELPRKA